MAIRDCGNFKSYKFYPHYIKRNFCRGRVVESFFAVFFHCYQAKTGGKTPGIFALAVADYRNLRARIIRAIFMLPLRVFSIFRVNAYPAREGTV